MTSRRCVAVIIGAMTALTLLGASVASAHGRHVHRTGIRHHRVEKQHPTNPARETIDPASATEQTPPASLPTAPAAVPAALPAPANASSVYRNLTDRRQFYMAQTSSYTCGPTVLAMAIADLILNKLPTAALVKELTKE